MIGFDLGPSNATTLSFLGEETDFQALFVDQRSCVRFYNYNAALLTLDSAGGGSAWNLSGIVTTETGQREMLLARSVFQEKESKLFEKACHNKYDVVRTSDNTTS